MAQAHRGLCELAANWLKRNHARGGPGCRIAVTEPRSGWSGESPDAIAWRAIGHLDGCFMVEAKTSRGDFLVDANKPHRGEITGLGNLRFYICPEGLISPDELPDRWGLLWVNNRGHIRSQVNPFIQTQADREAGANTHDRISRMWQASDQAREQFILVNWLARVGDAERVNDQLRTANRTISQLERQLRQVRDQRDEYLSALFACREGEC